MTYNKTIVLIHPDIYLLDFLKSFLILKGFEIITASYMTEGYAVCVKEVPHLIIAFKKLPDLDAAGLMTKKRINEAICSIPVFLMGDFSPEEIAYFKNENVKAFLSIPINPIALFERICLFFKIKLPPPQKRTPMLMDIHVKNHIIVVQLEGNLEPEKLELLNYLIRCFCREKKIKSPKLFLIIPSLYPESITEENIIRLFKFYTFSELEIHKYDLQVLSRNTYLLDELANIKNKINCEVAESYFDGINTLQLGFVKEKHIPASFIKEGATYVFDLYGNNGKKYIPALTTVTRAMLMDIQKDNIIKLGYYSDKTSAQINNQSEEALTTDDSQKVLFDFITGEYSLIESELRSVEIWNEKQTLFFRKMKGQNVLVWTRNIDMYTFIGTTLGIYFNIKQLSDGDDISGLLEKRDFSIIFLDASIDQKHQESLMLLNKIRSHVTRRKTSVIILATKMEKTAVLRYRKEGTDNILLYPFTSAKLLDTIFQAVHADRRT